jgi:hypothetical protein
MLISILQGVTIKAGKTYPCWFIIGWITAYNTPFSSTAAKKTNVMFFISSLRIDIKTINKLSNREAK